MSHKFGDFKLHLTPLDSLITPLELQPLLLPPRRVNVFGLRCPLAKLAGDVFLYFYFSNDVVCDGVPVPKVKPIKFRAKPVRQILCSPFSMKCGVKVGKCAPSGRNMRYIVANLTE